MMDYVLQRDYGGPGNDLWASDILTLDPGEAQKVLSRVFQQPESVIREGWLWALTFMGNRGVGSVRERSIVLVEHVRAYCEGKKFGRPAFHVTEFMARIRCPNCMIEVDVPVSNADAVAQIEPYFTRGDLGAGAAKVEILAEAARKAALRGPVARPWKDTRADYERMREVIAQNAKISRLVALSHPDERAAIDARELEDVRTLQRLVFGDPLPEDVPR